MDRRVIETPVQLVQRENGLYSSMTIASQSLNTWKHIRKLFKIIGTEVFEGRIYPDRPRKTWAEGCPTNEEGGMLWTSNLCIRKSLFDELGGLDERFKVAFEDVDLAYRLKESIKPSSLFQRRLFAILGELYAKALKTGKQRDINGNHYDFFLKSIPKA